MARPDVVDLQEQGPARRRRAVAAEAAAKCALSVSFLVKPTLTIPIPMRLQRRGGRKLIMSGGAGTQAEPRRDAGQGARARASVASEDQER